MNVNFFFVRAAQGDPDDEMRDRSLAKRVAGYLKLAFLPPSVHHYTHTLVI